MSTKPRPPAASATALLTSSLTTSTTASRFAKPQPSPLSPHLRLHQPRPSQRNPYPHPPRPSQQNPYPHPNQKSNPQKTRSDPATLVILSEAWSSKGRSGAVEGPLTSRWPPTRAARRFYPNPPPLTSSPQPAA